MALAESPTDSLGSLEVIRDEATEALLFSNPDERFPARLGFRGHQPDGGPDRNRADALSRLARAAI